MSPDVVASKKQSLQREIENPAVFMAQGDCCPTFGAGIVERERQIAALTDKLLDARPDSLRTKLPQLRTYVEPESSIFEGFLLQTRHECGRNSQSTLKNHDDTGRGTLRGLGTWNLVGRGSIDGAGGQNRTGYARLFRAALYH